MNKKNQGVSLKLNKFDMNRISDDSVVVLIGKRNTGKSFLTKYILYNNKSIPVGTVISGTEGANEFYSAIVPPVFIHEEYTPLILNNRAIIPEPEKPSAKTKSLPFNSCLTSSTILLIIVTNFLLLPI